MQRRSISLLERDAIRQGWKSKCAYCRKEVKEDYNIDHIVPHSHGGSCDLKNLCLSCVDCNQKKDNTRLPIFYEGLLLAIADRKYSKIKIIINNTMNDKPKVEKPFTPKKYDVKHYYCTDKKQWNVVIKGEQKDWLYNPHSQVNMKGIQEHGRKWRVQRRVRGILHTWICDTLSSAIKKRDEVFKMKYEDFTSGTT